MRTMRIVAAVALAVAVATSFRTVSADPVNDRGKKAFGQCAACHSLVAGEHRTGPSLAGIWGRKAASIDGFRRYSKALKAFEKTWDGATLDRWLENPTAFIPGNRMVFRGIGSAAERADLIAYLKTASEQSAQGAGGTRNGMQGGMGGMDAMGGQGPMVLKTLGANNRITSITHCADTYDITTESGETHQFWEFNIRLKTDSSANGPAKGAPVIIPAGMRGDRASIVFSSPGEISPAIGRKCQ